jgi:hypothetical protein
MCICKQHGLVQSDATYQLNYHDTKTTTPEATNLSLCIRVRKKSERKTYRQPPVSEMLYIMGSVELSLKHLR